MHQWDSGMSLPTDFTEIVIHCLPCSEIRGKHSPLHAGLHDVQDAVKSKTERREYFLNLSLGSSIFFITCHCLSVRLVGYLCITLMS